MKINSQKGFIPIIFIVIGAVVLASATFGVVKYKDEITANIFKVFKGSKVVAPSVDSTGGDEAYEETELTEEPIIEESQKDDIQLQEQLRIAEQKRLEVEKRLAEEKARQEEQRRLEAEQERQKELLRQQEIVRQQELERQKQEELISEILRYEKQKKEYTQKEADIIEKYNQIIQEKHNQIDQLYDEKNKLETKDGKRIPQWMLTGSIALEIEAINNKIDHLINEIQNYQTLRKMDLNELRIKHGRINEIEYLSPLPREPIISVPGHYSINPDGLGGYIIYDKNSYKSWRISPNGMGGYEIYEK